MLKMKQQYLIRGSGFISNRLSSLTEALYLPREWVGQVTANHIIYSAGYGNYYDQKDRYETYKANVLEPIRLLDNSKFDSFTYISTSSVLLPTQTDYSRSKKVMEWVLENQKKPYLIIRPSSVTGVGEQSQHLIPTLIRSCIDGEEMPFVGEPVHDFVDIEDFCDGIIFMIKNIDSTKEHTVNISSGFVYSNEEVKEMVEMITGKQANIKRVKSMRKYDTDKWIVKPDIFSGKPLELSIEEMVNDYTSKKDY
jgi:nucleoside-diphosphate-sugar epimerase